MTATAIDLFAGAGGFTEAARRVGIRVLYAANHNEDAVKVHAANHPDTQHVCQDLHQARWESVPRMDIVLASPACQGHSTAATNGEDGRNSAPKHDADRSTAWAVTACLDYHRPALAIVENVEEFTTWDCFRGWCVALEDMGYSIAMHYVDAADCGAPQHRERVFIVLARSRAPLWLMLPRTEHQPFRPCIDWDAEGRTTLAERKPGVGVRVRAGRARIPHGPFLTQHTTGHRGRSLDRPIGTITTHRHWCLVRREGSEDLVRDLTPQELLLGQGFERGYQLTGVPTIDTRLIGNAVSPIAGAALLEAVLRAA